MELSSARSRESALWSFKKLKNVDDSFISEVLASIGSWEVRSLD
jgi:hypothetical protein